MAHSDELERGRIHWGVQNDPAREADITRVRALVDECGTGPDIVERTYRSTIAGFVEQEIREIGLDQ